MKNKFPIQKVSSKLKTKVWFRDSVIYGVNAALEEDNSIKPSNKTIIDNYKVYNGERDTSDMRETFDPASNLNKNYKPTFKAFSTISDRIDELVGEYILGGFDYVIAAIDRDSINKKVAESKERIVSGIKAIIEDESINNKEEVMKRLKSLSNFKFISKAEVTANKVLNYYKTANGLKYKEAEGFRNALITAVAGFDVYIENGELKIDLLSSDEIYAVRSGNSNNLQESEIIAIVKYYPPSKIIDKYGEYLKEKDIKKVLTNSFGLYDSAENEAKHKLVFKSIEELNEFTSKSNGSIEATNPIDNNGNIRTVKVKWLGYRKIFKKKSYDKDGNVVYSFVSEYATPDIDKGEVFTSRWIKEWHSGILIGSDIVVDAKVEPYQFIDIKNINKNRIGIVGGYFNVGNEKAKSLIDKVKNYLYFRDMIFAKIDDILSKNIGKAIELDLSLSPDKWKISKILFFLKRYNILVKNSFNLGKEGAARGKIAGSYSQGNRVLDAELGASIGYLIQILQLIDVMIAKTTGVTDQRLGNIATRELVGNVERSRTQSSYITEIWFNRYEQIILDLYDTIIEVSKKAVNEDDRLQFILDDTSLSILKDGISEFKNSRFGLFPVNRTKFGKLKGILEQLALQAVPNGTMSVSQLVSLFTSNSTSEMIDKQLGYERESKDAQAELEKMRNDAKQKEIEAAKKYDLEMRNIEQNFKERIEEIKGDYKVLVEQMKIKDKAISDHIEVINKLGELANSNGLDFSKMMLENKKIDNSVKTA